MSLTIDDLIQSGVQLHEARLAERARQEEEERMRQARSVAEAKEAILSLLPEALRSLAEVKVKPLYGDATPPYGKVRIPVRGGHVLAYAKLIDGTWAFVSNDKFYRRRGQVTFEGWNPTGQHQWFHTLEEALAYAAGAIA